jgi:hypothetical protein
MIINGGSRCNAHFFAGHLTKAEDNERVTLCGFRNLAADNVAGALQEMETVALATQCKNYFYHANINPQITEELTQQQWDHAVDTLERTLGLEGHARFIVEHRKKGRTHRHVIWSRIDVTTMRAPPMTDDYEKHQATSRQLERELGLERGKSVLGPDKVKGQRPKRRPKAWESFRGQKSGIDPLAMTVEITALYRVSRSGKEFAAALEEHGYRLIKADRRDLCLMDAAGHLHSIVRRIDGVTAGAFEDFVRDIDRSLLPTVAEARKSGNIKSTQQ